MSSFNSIANHRIIYGTEAELNNSSMKIKKGILIDNDSKQIYSFTGEMNNGAWVYSTNIMSMQQSLEAFQDNSNDPLVNIPNDKSGHAEFYDSEEYVYNATPVNWNSDSFEITGFAYEESLTNLNIDKSNAIYPETSMQFSEGFSSIKELYHFNGYSSSINLIIVRTDPGVNPSTMKISVGNVVLDNNWSSLNAEKTLWMIMSQDSNTSGSVAQALLILNSNSNISITVEVKIAFGKTIVKGSTIDGFTFSSDLRSIFEGTIIAKEFKTQDGNTVVTRDAMDEFESGVTDFVETFANEIGSSVDSIQNSLPVMYSGNGEKSFITGDAQATAENENERSLGGHDTVVSQTAETKFDGQIESQMSEFVSTAFTINGSIGKTQPFMKNIDNGTTRYGYATATLFGKSIAGEQFVDKVIFSIDFQTKTVDLISTSEEINSFTIKPTYELVYQEAEEGVLPGVVASITGIDGKEIIYSFTATYTILTRALSMLEIWGVAAKLSESGLNKLPSTAPMAGQKEFETFSVVERQMEVGTTISTTFSNNIWMNYNRQLIVFKLDLTDIDFSKVLSIKTNIGSNAVLTVYDEAGTLIAQSDTAHFGSNIILNADRTYYVAATPSAPGAIITQGESDLFEFDYSFFNNLRMDSSVSDGVVLISGESERGDPISAAEVVINGQELTKNADAFEWTTTTQLARGTYTVSVNDVFVDGIVATNDHKYSFTQEVTVNPYIKYFDTVDSNISRVANDSISGTSKEIIISGVNDIDEAVTLDKNLFDWNVDYPNSLTCTNGFISINGEDVDLADVDFKVSYTAKTEESPEFPDGSYTGTIYADVDSISVAIASSKFIVGTIVDPFSVSINQPNASYNIPSDLSAVTGLSFSSSDDTVIEVISNNEMVVRGTTGQTATITATITHPITGVSATSTTDVTIEPESATVSYGNISISTSSASYSSPVDFPMTITDTDGVDHTNYASGEQYAISSYKKINGYVLNLVPRSVADGVITPGGLYASFPVTSLSSLGDTTATIQLAPVFDPIDSLEASLPTINLTATIHVDPTECYISKNPGLYYSYVSPSTTENFDIEEGTSAYNGIYYGFAAGVRIDAVPAFVREGFVVESSDETVFVVDEDNKISVTGVAGTSATLTATFTHPVTGTVATSSTTISIIPAAE